MKFTLSRTELLNRLEAQKAKDQEAVVAAIKKHEVDFKAKLKKAEKELIAALKVIKSGKIPRIHFYDDNGKHRLKIDHREINRAIAMVKASTDETFVLSDSSSRYKKDLFDLISDTF